jgi:Fur family ferric uptake transcriptional regulator
VDVAESISKQGRIILECLKDNQDCHLTADDISEKLKKKENPVSTATIYRQLDKMTAMGLIRKYTSSPDEPACYQFHGTDSGCSRHFHLKCIECNRLIHVSCDYLNEIEHHVKEHHKFFIDNTRTVLYGYCESCAEKREEKEKWTID